MNNPKVRRSRHPKIHLTNGGKGGTVYLLLHGLGATGEVWNGVCNLIEKNRLGQWMVPDMRGHGKSEWAYTYELGEHSSDIAKLIRDKERIIVIGHSMGGIVGLSIATGKFGVNVDGLIVIGTITNWDKNDTKRFAELAKKPVKWFPNRETAVERYLKVSGLDGLITEESPLAEAGIKKYGRQFRLAADNATGTIGGPWMEELLKMSQCPVILAAGEHDPMVGIGDYLIHDRNAFEIPNVGHNAHVENPEAIIDLTKILKTQA